MCVGVCVRARVCECVIRTFTHTNNQTSVLLPVGNPLPSIVMNCHKIAHSQDIWVSRRAGMCVCVHQVAAATAHADLAPEREGNLHIVIGLTNRMYIHRLHTHRGIKQRHNARFTGYLLYKTCISINSERCTSRKQ